MTSLDVAGISVAPGTRQRHSIELTELADGTRVSIPLDLVNGAQPGPRLYLGAAIHGDEVDGVGILSARWPTWTRSACGAASCACRCSTRCRFTPTTGYPSRSS